MFLSKLGKSKPQRRIGVTLTLQETDEGYRVRALDEDGVTAVAECVCEKQAADQPDRAEDTIRRQLAKTGDTWFACDGVQIETQGARFLPVSVLNTLRREALERLADARATARPRRAGGAVKNDVPCPERAAHLLGQRTQRPRARVPTNATASKPSNPAAESGVDMYGRKVMTTRYCLRRQLGWCRRDGNAPDVQEPLYLADADGNKLELRFACDRCEMDLFLADE